MTKSHRSETFSGPEGIWLWCLHCERSYKDGEYREEDGYQMCPYPDCNGTTVLDGWTWEHIREIHPEYPEEPERDKVYPLYTKAETGGENE